jgi:regulator of sigma E protease
MAVRSLGLVFPLMPKVASVLADSPAAQAGIQAGDEITTVAFGSTDPDKDTGKLIYDGDPMELNDHTFTWPFIYELMQSTESDTRITLSYRRGAQTMKATLQPMRSDEGYGFRGMVFTTVQETRVASSWQEALSLGYGRTKEDMQRVLVFLKKLITGGVSPKNLGGPISIIAVAGNEASKGLSSLLIFLTFLSANLAILNFLPIPALDGGHMVFLMAEGVRGKPVDERMQVALTLAGVACLLGLMIFVFVLDIDRFLL